jgi:mannose-6-phosphate isomerase class I
VLVKNDPIKLSPAFKDYLWGGVRLKTEFHKNSDLVPLAESWELSAHKDGQSVVCGGEYDSMPLSAFLDAVGRDVLGENCAKYDYFPLLIKLIDAKGDLSVQVHPSDAYALANEGQFGKCEMWYILEAAEGAGLYLGFERETNAEEVRAAAENGTVESLLHFQPVKPGEVYFIPPGTVHAIGAGVMLFEIQQNSTLTYRLYDYKRRDKDGNERPLHLEKGLLVTEFSPYKAEKIRGDDPCVIGTCEYFETRLYKLKLAETAKINLKDTFVSLTCVRGKGTVCGEKIKRGESVFIPANEGEIEIAGEMEILAVSV